MPILNLEKYMYYLDDEPLSIEEKQQCIHAMWNFANSVVEKAFGQHPIQQLGCVSGDGTFTKNNQQAIIFMRWLYGHRGV